MKNGLVNSFVQIFDRDLGKLETEIKQYSNESHIWKIDGDIKNSAGNLCLHLCGNLQHYVGAVLGNSGFQRNRPVEFSAKNISQAKLLDEIIKTRQVVNDTLKKLNDDSLQKMYPEEVLGYPMTAGFFIIHLLGHFNYHLGQVNYHRRLVA
jgi:uncharacterized damage-inducible protein DinB